MLLCGICVLCALVVEDLFQEEAIGRAEESVLGLKMISGF